MASLVRLGRVDEVAQGRFGRDVVVLHRLAERAVVELVGRSFDVRAEVLVAGDFSVDEGLQILLLPVAQLVDRIRHRHGEGAIGVGRYFVVVLR